MDEFKSVIWDIDSAYFRYLQYSFQLTRKDCEYILDKLEDDWYSGFVNEFTLIPSLEKYCSEHIMTLEKEEKVAFLYNMIDNDDYFIADLKKRFRLNTSDLIEIADKVESDIQKDNIPNYIIKRNFESYCNEYYQINKNLRQLNVISDNIKSKLILNKLNKLNNLTLSDVRKIINDLKIQIEDGHFFEKSMRSVVLSQMDHLSVLKKNDAQKLLYNICENSGESFDNFLKHYNLTKSDGDELLNRLNTLIDEGEILRSNLNINMINHAKAIGDEKINE